MEESANRYFLVIFLRNESRTFFSEPEVREFINAYKKINKDENSVEVYGKLVAEYKIESRNWVVEYPVYKKITKKYPLENADKFTSDNFEDESSLKNYFANYVESETGEIYLGYMMNGEVRIIPVLYAPYKAFGNYEDIIDMLIERAGDKRFMVAFLSNETIINLQYKKDSIICVKRLNDAYGRFWRNKENILNIRELIKDFVRAYCISKNKINQRLVRELGLIVKDTFDKLGEKPKEKSRAIIMEGF